VAASRLRPETVGTLGLMGEEAQVVDEVGPQSGNVRVHGELWQARSAATIPVGAKVKIEKVEGLLLTVSPKGAA
jgi:membrane-bound serine protease (ClpP class)